LLRRKGDADVDAQGQGAGGDDVPRDRRQPFSGRALVSPSMDEPRDSESGSVASQDFEDGLQIAGDAIPCRIASQEPCGEPDEA